ncbi:hypothetical protein Hsero_3071 [Herbaspirillum seropedicae SmR1]|uniref:Uncharacterized protein n=1 Tax=Herbaspirillum seropedicae (strain SmR1) TaxID=757424 RepID=D8J0K3_HERSS|nr:hypothetical protein Hsero_3071 [Herbaspirillum seropedicae SmR1]
MPSGYIPGGIFLAAQHDEQSAQRRHPSHLHSHIPVMKQEEANSRTTSLHSPMARLPK